MERPIWWQQPRLLAAALCVVAGIAVIALGLLLRAVPTPTPVAAEPLDPFAADLLVVPTPLPVEPTIPPPPPDLIVYVSGAVAQPDVYRLPAGARVKDVVVAAGGLLPDAAAEMVNLAAPITDAAHIHIPKVGEIAAPISPALSADPVPAPNTGSPPPAAVPGLLDLNRATQAELEELPGIGTVLAERIVAYRTEHGAFASVADLRSVTGIGAKLFAQLEPLVVVYE